VLLDQLAVAHPRYTDIAEVVRLARDGQVACRRVLADAGHHIGVAVANLCNIFNPDRIIIGGELAQADELILGPMRRVLHRQGIPSAATAVDIVTARLGARSQLLGALVIASGGSSPAMLAVAARAVTPAPPSSEPTVEIEHETQALSDSPFTS
jgi:predicted NBD/HSP70 family sugar kinase